MRKRISIQQNLINHVGFVLDGSASMSNGSHDRQLVTLMDKLVQTLKDKSQEMNQETRVTIYIFSADSQVVCYDIDVLRSPTLRGIYEATGRSTALVDSTYMAITDMKQTATLYGDHAFLFYALTDGFDNASSRTSRQLSDLISRLGDNWTLAALVPSNDSRDAAIKWGFPAHNIQTWDTASSEGIVEVGEIVTAATTNYYNMRQGGTRGTNNLFNLDTSYLKPAVVQATLTPMDNGRFSTFEVDRPLEVIKDAVVARRGTYRQGSTYYQLTKAETIQPQKRIIVRDKASNQFFEGDAARQLLGLPNMHARVSPPDHPAYDIFVQSTSSNRKLVGGTTAVVVV